MKKLKKILLINWLYFSKELIEVGDINFLTGKNGAGKSTVIDALQIVLLGETNARNFNQAANEKSQRTLEGYLRADMDDNSPYSRRGKDFSTYIVCEFQDEMEGSSFVTGVTFDCRSDGSYRDTFFIYTGTLPKNCFIEQGEAIRHRRHADRRNGGLDQRQDQADGGLDQQVHLRALRIHGGRRHGDQLPPALLHAAHSSKVGMTTVKS